MKWKLIGEQDNERTFVLVFNADDEVMAGLRRFAQEANLIAARLSAIGALRNVTLGFFDPEAKRYHYTVLNEQVEVLSLLGNVAARENGPAVHAHIVVGKRDATAYGGHLIEAFVRPTLEVVVVESPHHLQRQHDEATGLAMLQV